jgi:hypothetical protein
MPYLSINGLRADGTLMTDEETDAAAVLGRGHGIFRQCSIGWHAECSDPRGIRCKCTCHDADRPHLRLNPDPRSVE